MLCSSPAACVRTPGRVREACARCVVRPAGSVPHTFRHERAAWVVFPISFRHWRLYITPPAAAAAHARARRARRLRIRMASPVWAQVVRDVCARKTTEEEPQQSVQEDADLEEPLFASHTPANGLTPALQAIAAIIDEDDVRPEPSRPTKRKAESLGEAQVCLALTGLGADSAQPQHQRQRVQTDAATRMQP